MHRTSVSHPLYLDRLPITVAPRFAAYPGQLDMTILPGKYQPGGMAGDHARDLEADAARLAARGVTTFVLLVEDWELDNCRVPNFIATLARYGITVLHYPMVDGHTPRDRSHREPRSGSVDRPATPVPGDMRAFVAALAAVEAKLAAGETIGMSCRGGLGRTGLFAACLLMNGGLDAETAMTVTRQARRGTIENPYQEAFVRAWRGVPRYDRTAP